MRAAMLVVGNVLVVARACAARQMPKEPVSRIEVVGVVYGVGLAMRIAGSAFTFRVERIDRWMDCKRTREALCSAAGVEVFRRVTVIFLP